MRRAIGGYLDRRKQKIKERKERISSYQRELDLFNEVGAQTTLTHQHILTLLGRAENEIGRAHNPHSPANANFTDKHYRFCAISGENDRSLDGNLADLISDFQSDRTNDRVSIVLCRGRLQGDREIVGNTHWTTLHLRKDPDGRISAYHFNSAGNDIPLAVRRVVQDAFGIPLEYKEAPQQRDGYSCGYHAFYNALRANKADSLQASDLGTPDFNDRKNITPEQFVPFVRNFLEAEFNNRVADPALVAGRAARDARHDAGSSDDMLIAEMARGPITPLAKALIESILLAPAGDLTPIGKIASIKEIQGRLIPPSPEDQNYFRKIYEKLAAEWIEVRRNQVRNEADATRVEAERLFNVIGSLEFKEYLFNAGPVDIADLQTRELLAFRSPLNPAQLTALVTVFTTRAPAVVVADTVDARNRALIAAITAGRDDQLLALLEGGAQAFACDAEKKSALLHAVERGSDFAVNLLLSHGAEPNVVSNAGDNPLLAACRNNNLNSVVMVQALAQLANLALLKEAQDYLQRNTTDANRELNERKINFLLDEAAKFNRLAQDTNEFRDSTNGVLMQFHHLLEEIRSAASAAAPVVATVNEKSNKAINFCQSRFPDEQAQMLEMLVDSYLKVHPNDNYAVALQNIVTTLIEQGALQNAQATASRIADVVLAKFTAPGALPVIPAGDRIIERLLHISGRAALSFKAFDVFVKKFGLIAFDAGTITNTLHHAVDNNNLEVLASALASPNCTQNQKDELLLYAIKQRNHFAVDKCVEFGANIFRQVEHVIPAMERAAGRTHEILSDAQIRAGVPIGNSLQLIDFIVPERQKEIKIKAFTHCVWNENPTDYFNALNHNDNSIKNYKSGQDHVLTQACKAAAQKPDQALALVRRLVPNHIRDWKEIDAAILHSAAAYGSIEILRHLCQDPEDIGIIGKLKEPFEGKNVFEHINEQARLAHGKPAELTALQEKRTFLHNYALQTLNRWASQPALLGGYTIVDRGGGNFALSLGGAVITDNSEIESQIFAIHQRYMAARFTQIVPRLRNQLIAYTNQAFNDAAIVIDKPNLKRKFGEIFGNADSAEAKAAVEYALCHMLSERNKLAAGKDKAKLARADNFIHHFLLNVGSEYYSLYANQTNLAGVPIAGSRIIDIVSDPVFKQKLRSDYLFALANKGRRRYERLKEAIEADKEIRDIKHPDQEFKTALDIVLEKGDVNSARLLAATVSNHSLPFDKTLKGYKDQGSSLEKAIDRADVEAVKILIESQVEIFQPEGASNRANEFDCWALRYAYESPYLMGDPNKQREIIAIIKEAALKEIYQVGKTVLHTQHPNGWTDTDNSLTFEGNTIQVSEDKFGQVKYQPLGIDANPDFVRQMAQTVWRKEKEFEKKLAKEFNGILEKVMEKNDDASHADLTNFLGKYQGEEKILTLAFACVIGQLNADRLRSTNGLAENLKYWFSPFYTSINRRVDLNQAQANILKDVAKQIIDIGRIEITTQWQDKPHKRGLLAHRAKRRDAKLRSEKPHGILPLIRFIDTEKYKEIKKELVDYALLNTADSYSLNAPYFRELGFNRADIMKQDVQGRNALHLAFENGNLEIIEEIAKRDDAVIQALLQQTSAGETPLMVAARLNRAKEIEFFCNNVKDPARFLNEIKGVGGMTPLMSAARHGSLRSVQTLLEFGADKKVPSEIDAAAEEGVAPRKMIARDFTDETPLGKDIRRRLSDGRTLARTLSTEIEEPAVEARLLPHKSNTRNLVCDYGGRIKITADDLQFKTAFQDGIKFEGVNFAGNGVRITKEHPNGVISEMRDRHSFVKLHGARGREFTENFKRASSPEAQALYKGYFQAYHSQFYKMDFEDKPDKKIFGRGSYLFMSYFNNCSFGDGVSKRVNMREIIDPWAVEMEREYRRGDRYIDKQGREHNIDEIENKKFAIIRSLHFYNCDMRGIDWPQNRAGFYVLPNLVKFPDTEEGRGKYDAFIEKLTEWRNGAATDAGRDHYDRYLREYAQQNAELQTQHTTFNRAVQHVKNHFKENDNLNMRDGVYEIEKVDGMRTEPRTRGLELSLIQTAPNPTIGRDRAEEVRRFAATRLARAARHPGRAGAAGDGGDGFGDI